MKYALPALANTERLHGEVVYCETVTFVDGQRQITPPEGRTANAHPVAECKPISCGEPFFITNAFVGGASTVRVLRSSVSMATPPQVPLWAAPPSQTRAPRVLSLPPRLLASGDLGNSQ